MKTKKRKKTKRREIKTSSAASSGEAYERGGVEADEVWT
jgi:hypothetical protein